MTLALSAMDPTVQGSFFLVAVVLFTIEAVMTRALVAAGLAFATFVFMWQAFALS